MTVITYSSYTAPQPHIKHGISAPGNKPYKPPSDFQKYFLRQQPSAEVLKLFQLSAQKARTITFYRPKEGSCVECADIGYKGQLAIFEIMMMTPAIARLVMERATMHKIQEQAIKDGMTLLLQDGLSKIEQGLTSADEVLSVAAAAHDTVEA